MMDEALRKVFLKYPKLALAYPSLKTEQATIIEYILQKETTFVNLPTGFGKSATYILAPLLADETDTDIAHIAVVISPLLSIINEQVALLKSYGVKAHAVTSESTSNTLREMTSLPFFCIAFNCNAVEKGETQIVFLTPECALQLRWKEMIQNLSDRLSVLVADEFHVVITWGDTFRRKYKRIAELCSFTDAPLLFLTGTTTRSIQEKVASLFGLTEYKTVSRTPDRDNVCLFVKSVPHDHEQLDWLVKYYIEHGVEGKKTIIFTPNIEDARKLYFWILDLLEKAGKAYTGDCASVLTRIMDMYHSKVTPKKDMYIRSEFPKTNSTIRLLVSTLKLGMGVDIRDIAAVVVFGGPKNILDLWQQVGRCARSGERGLAVVYLTGKAMTGCEDVSLLKMKKEKDGCFRSTILEAFTLGPTVTNEQHMRVLCAGDCTKVCNCALCMCCNYCREMCQCPKSSLDVKIVLESL